jgi:predicted small secreted protein
MDADSSRARLANSSISPPQHRNHEPTTNMITLTKRFVLLLLVTALFAVVSTGCNTAHGFGKDVTKTGDAIQRNTK